MKLMLIAPASGQWRGVGQRKIWSGRTFRFSLLSLLSVAAETPPEVDVQLIDEQVEDVPLDAKPDLVGITCMTALAPRAYEIAQAFRARGVPVVLGGMHPTFRSDEALQYADAVVAGEAEGVWTRVLNDAKNGTLSGVYRADRPADLSNLKNPPLYWLKKKNYSAFPVQATRGCPHACSFCSVTAFNHNQQRRRPIPRVIESVRKIPSRFFLFVDDHLNADRDYAMELFRQLTPLRKKWVTQSTLAVAEDPGMVETMAKAGCIGIFTGMETFCRANLESMNKTCHEIERYRESVRLFHRYGIGVESGIVLGFDGDGPDTFENTLGMLDDLQIDALQASIFTPLPGTPQFEQMKDRILDWNWAHYDFHHPVFQPRRMSVESLQAGHDWLTREFYSPARIVKRLARWVRQPRGIENLPYAAAINLAYYGRIRSWHIHGWNPNVRPSNVVDGVYRETYAL